MRPPGRGHLPAGSVQEPRPYHFMTEPLLELEIGCGKGKFLISRALESPERNFIGIDYAGKWMRVGETRSQQRQLKNLTFFKAEAWNFLKKLPDKIIDTCHIYFPDPWPKRRHQARRLLTPDFLKLLYTRLKPCGFIELATDDPDYYKQIKSSLAETKLLWQSLRETVNERISFPHLQTNYEVKFQAAGRALHYIEAQKGGIEVPVEYRDLERSRLPRAKEPVS